MLSPVSDINKNEGFFNIGVKLWYSGTPKEVTSHGRATGAFDPIVNVRCYFASARFQDKKPWPAVGHWMGVTGPLTNMHVEKVVEDETPRRDLRYLSIDIDMIVDVSVLALTADATAKDGKRSESGELLATLQKASTDFLQIATMTMRATLLVLDRYPNPGTNAKEEAVNSQKKVIFPLFGPPSIQYLS